MVSFSAHDAEGRSSKEWNAQLTILSAERRQKLVITTRAIPAIILGAPADFTFACTGGKEPFAWTVKGDLPPGILLKGASLTGRPKKTGRYALHMTVADSRGDSDGKQFHIEVPRLVPFWLLPLVLVLLVFAVAMAVFLLFKRKRQVGLDIITADIPNARASFHYSVQLACIGGCPPYHWRITRGELPPGLSLDRDGKIHGTPCEGTPISEPVKFDFTVEVRDVKGTVVNRNL